MALSPYYVRDGQLRPLTSSFFGGPSTLYKDDFSTPSRIDEWNRGGESVGGTFEITSGVLRYTVGAGDSTRPRINRPIDVANGSWVRIIVPATTGTSPRPEFFISADRDDWGARLFDPLVEESANLFVQVPTDGFNRIWLVLRAGTGSVAGDTVEIDRITVLLEQVADLPPTAVNDVASTSVNTDVDINVLANDIAGTNQIDSSSLRIIDQPNQGAAGAAGGLAMYTPPTDYVGLAQFTYDVADISGLRSNKASCEVTVSAAPPGGGVLGTTSYPAPLSTSTVSSMGAVQSAANGAAPGTHIILNSNASGKAIITANGTAANPIVIRSDGTRRTINGQLEITGSHVWVWGLRFTGPRRYGILWRGEDHKCINCQFDQMGSSSSFIQVNMIWAPDRTERCEVGWCDFTSPVSFRSWTSVAADGQWPQWRFGFRGDESSPSTRTYEMDIHHCWFYDFPGIDEGTGQPQSQYRAAQSDFIEMAPTGTTEFQNNQIRYCLMEDGRSIHGSIVDGKDGRGLIVEHCTLLDCAGRLSFRTMHDGTARHLWFEDCDQGFAVFGVRHKLTDLFFTGSGARRIEAFNGDVNYGDSPQTPLRPAVDDLIIECCPTANIVLGARYSYPYRPRDTIIRGSYASLNDQGIGTQLVSGFSCSPSLASKLARSQVGTAGLANL